MRILSTQGNDELARVFVAELGAGRRLEFVESLQPPHTRDEKWVLIVSTLLGCPVGCPFCDAGGGYRGKLSGEDILAQITWLIARRYPDLRVPSRMLKIQLARMGEPALNDGVLDALEALPSRIDAPGLLPSLSTVAPIKPAFFERLADIKRRVYPSGRFQLQFSLHTTDPARRRELVPIRTWSFAEMAAYGESFRGPGDRLVTLNFAAAADSPLDPSALLEHFDPEHFLVKLTPINPTRRAGERGLVSAIDPEDHARNAALVEGFERAGYRTILSIGELDENRIGSNCGMYLDRYEAAEA
ncbi:MAG: radical SAM protein [Deltaproteobacteria bacterium]|nr:radical SAM protein [Deltaproteobacteria bacterium]